MNPKSVYEEMGKKKKTKYDPDWIISIKNKQRSEVLGYLKKKKIKTILDVGCGPARYLTSLLKLGYKATGVDFSREMLLVAKEELAKNGLQTKLICAKVQSLPKSLKNFDAVVCIDTFHHLTKKERIRAMEHLIDSVKKGGVIIVDVKNKYNPYFFIQHHILFPYYHVPQINFSYSVGEINAVARKKNCRLVLKKSSLIPFSFLDPLVTCFFEKQ